MQRVKLMVATAVSALTLACATKPPGTDVSASDFDLHPLVGVWRGDFKSSQTNRSGIVAFTRCPTGWSASS